MTIPEEGIRSFPLEGMTHDVDDTAHTVTVDFPFERMDSYRSDFGRGWCDEYLHSNRPVMVVHHDPRALIGRMVPAGYQNLGDRAQITGKFSDFEKVPLASEYFAHIRDDEIPGWSFHYRNGRGIPHPSGQRGAVRYTKGDMAEYGPTPFPAIPGAGAVGLRSEETTLSIPTLSELLQLGRELRLDSEGIRSMVAEHYPTLVEHITVPALDAIPKAQRALDAIVADFESGGFRAMTINVGDDGTVTTSHGDAENGDQDAEELVSSLDAVLDQAVSLLDGVEVTSLPDNVQQAIALTQAAGTVVDELLDVMGVPDPDDGQRSEAEMDLEDGDRAVMSAADRDDLPDSAFAYVEDGEKDADGNTTPRSKRHFPIAGADGKPDPAHVRNALARIGQGAKFGDKAKAKVEAAANKLGIDSDSGTRSEPDEQAERLRAQSEGARARLERLDRRRR